MGANSTQAVAFLMFVLAFVLMAGAMAAGGSVPLFAASLALLAGSCIASLRAKPWENSPE
jgi:hypothetical protein